MITYQSTYISYLGMLCYARIETMNFFVGHQILMPQLDCQVWFSLNTEYTYYKVGLQLQQQSDQRRQLYVSVLIFLVLAFLLFLSSPFTSLQSRGGWFHNGVTSVKMEHFYYVMLLYFLIFVKCLGTIHTKLAQQFSKISCPSP